MNNTKYITTSKGMPLSEAKAFIDTIDLHHIVCCLVRIERWLEDEALAAVEQYRRFLHLKKKYGSQYILPPSYEIDEVWHSHILHSEHYVAFCEKVFGEYLHHHIHLITEAKNLEKLNERFKKTQKLYHHEFGEYIYTIKKHWLINILYKIKQKIYY